MLQAYPGSSPVRDVLTGRISLRQFRVMVEHLPPGNPLDRARSGHPWAGRDDVALLYEVESRLRELVVMLGNLFRAKGEPPREVPYLDRPLSAEELERRAAQEAYDDLMQRQLEEL